MHLEAKLFDFRASSEARDKQVEDKQVSIPLLKKVRLQAIGLRAVTADKHCSLNYLRLFLCSLLAFPLYSLRL